ncbi:MAG: DUF3800 domain-containing protein, partial [bacterium]
SRNDGMDHFALGGILVAEGNREILKNKYKEFCEKWKINYPLHSTKIRGMRGNFGWLVRDVKRKENFLIDLECFLVSLPVIGFAAVIHRPGYNNRYKERYGDKRWLMCKTAYTILIERVVKYVRNAGGALEIRFEQAGKKEDRLIKSYTKDMKLNGHPFNEETSCKYKALRNSDYKKFVLGEPKEKKKNNLFTQIADLYLYPMVKRKYDDNYAPWSALYKNGKVIDAYLPEVERETQGIKYSCFDSLLRR